MRRGAWLHCLLSAYLWLIAWIPLGNWNRQRGGTFLTALLAGKSMETGDVGMLVFVSLPAILFWVAYKRNSFWFGVGASAVDAIWLGLQIQSWWIPYIFGTHTRWRLEYANAPTTKLLPSFGHHVAPDGMHLVISILLISALTRGVSALWAMKAGQVHSQVRARWLPKNPDSTH